MHPRCKLPAMSLLPSVSSSKPQPCGAQAAAASAAKHTRQYLAECLEMEILSEQMLGTDLDEVALRDLTAILSLGGASSVMVAFSVDLSLALEIRRIETRDLRLPGEDAALYLHAALAEMANVVLGHCTADLATGTAVVTLSTPVVIESKRLLTRPDQTRFAQVAFDTPHGRLDIACIAPRDRFDAQLNPLPPGKESPCQP